MGKLKFAIFGTGFWSNFQIPAWKELEGVECVAAYNRTRSRAEEVAQKFGIPKVYDDPKALLESEDLDFVDIITDVDTHAPFTEMAARKGLHVICQKPMGPTREIAAGMLDVCRQQGVRLFIHENFRWQAPMRKLKEIIDSGIVGTPFKARVSFCSAFPVFENQPFLAELDHFILTDVGSHVLDVCRYLFGEATSLYCSTNKINPGIKGEDVANVMLKMDGNVTCFAEMSYASILEKEAFPQVFVLIEASKGSLVLTHDYEIRMTTREGTESQFVRPKIYDWLDPEYAVVHSSIVDCNRDLLNGLKGGKCETTGEDNIKTVDLVWASYESAKSNKVIFL